jgi:hypothetical protein
MGIEEDVPIPTPVPVRVLPEIRVLVPGVKLLPSVWDVPNRPLPVVCAKALGNSAKAPKTIPNATTTTGKS